MCLAPCGHLAVVLWAMPSGCRAPAFVPKASGGSRRILDEIVGQSKGRGQQLTTCGSTVFW
ncbi:hypothetical protein SBA1_750013 [Candidatus Sulfotelmatobacter kueseliae]|uniref:Uncharacterized protein n=1 Tax=Candidatus Sulfotelmatobacter kueseliae TaxID=2042962 RepID=A0A2U3L6K2_9BACT|nr:hypothetical protein SBA1_750013 [Candidatus Sulfotelmatobacter kueseliae]